MDLVELHFYHGGKFRKEPELTYVGGKVKIFEKIDVDELCFFWIEELAQSCGNYVKIEELYFLIPGLSLDEGLKRIFNDVEVMEIARLVASHGFVKLFVVTPHNIFEPQQQSQIVESDNNLSNVAISSSLVRKKLVPIRPKEFISKDMSSSPLKDNEVVLNDVPNVDDIDDWNDFEIEDLVFDDEDNIQNDVGVECEILEELQDDIIGADSDTSDDECRAARENIGVWNKKILDIVLQLQKEAEDGAVKESNKEISNNSVTECISEYEDSDDDIVTPGESEEDDALGKKKRKLTSLIDDSTDFTKLKWKVGMTFESREKFKDAVTKYSIIQGRHLAITVSNKSRQQRLGVRCLKGCPFQMYASWDLRRVCFVLKSVCDKHKCTRNMKRNRQMKSAWLANQFLEVFKSRPHWPAKEICETVRRAYRVIIKPSYAYKIKYWAHKKLHGSMKDHYNKLGRYVEALKERSPNCVFKIETDLVSDSSPPVFKRFFVSFDALSQGWLEGCRKVVCLDGCFLKTFLGGMLLVAVGRDANDQMYPIAWAVVEGENNDSWEWFLVELRHCLKEVNEGDKWTFISDQQKGIINAVAHVFGKAEHRNCARHVYANWHKTYKGDELKGLFWRAVRAYNEAEFYAAIEELDGINHAACTAFKAQNPKTFCRAFVNTQTKCDVIVNNLAETFNGYIINARTKHLIYMLEDIRTSLMQRLNNKKVEMEKDDSLLCPRIQAKLDKEKEELGNCFPMPSSETVFQVSHKMDSLVVDLQNRSCTCRKWQLTGIPCCHALACIYFKNEDGESYVNECYLRASYLKSYSKSIQPCNGERHWPIVNVAIDPPRIKIGPGRPRRNRRKDPHEDPKKSGKLTRHGTVMTCSVCKSSTHTKTKCPDKDKIVQSQPKRGRGRPRKFYAQPRHISSEAINSLDHHNATAEPSRIGTGGRTIMRGRGFRRGGKVRRGGRGTTIPSGFGVYIADTGATIINNPGQSAPTILSEGVRTTSYPSSSSQASINHSPL